MFLRTKILPVLGLLMLIPEVISVDAWSSGEPHRPRKQSDDDFPFLDIHLSWEDRVDDLVGRLTLEELTGQMANGGETPYCPGIPRLGIKPYSWGSECLRGVVHAGNATSFPQALGMAATFSTELLYKMASATGLETRAKHNNHSWHGDYGPHTGASCWSPVINIMRDPRWGRNQETYGEDPYLTGQMAAAFVRGLQGNHPRYIPANAGCKHFAVYAGPENIPSSRFSFNAQVTERDLRMTFLPQFQACVEAGTYSIMCSYSSINGVPACGNRMLLTEILRQEWGFNGYVVSDESAIENILYKFHYTSNVVDTAALAVKAGTNLEDASPPVRNQIYKNVSAAVTEGELDLEVVRQAVKPLFYTRMRLGEFDPVSLNPYAKMVPGDYVQSEAHRQLAITIAMSSMVLLKNDMFLPLAPNTKFKQMAMIGPAADDVELIFGGYASIPDPQFLKTPRAGLRPLAQDERYAAGCSDAKCQTYNASEVKTAVLGADLVVVCLGTGPTIEQEGNDKTDITLPGYQLQLLQDAVSYASGPVVLLLFNAGPLDVSWAQNSLGVRTIIECFFSAQATGEALYRVFYNQGPGANPAGRLPATWPRNISQVPAMVNYTMEGRTYRYSDVEPLYPFGYGLSYTTFTYHALNIHPVEVRYGNPVTVDVYVQNTGLYDGEEVVQVYISWTNATSRVPNLQLVGFKRISLATGLGQTVQFIIRRKQLTIWDDTRGFVLPKDYQEKIPETTLSMIKVYVGGQQPFQSRSVGSNVLSSAFTVV